MRDDEGHPLQGTVAPHSPFPGRDLLLLATAIVICVASWAVFAEVRSFSTEIHINREVGYANRAAVCDMQRGIGLAESKTCNDPGVRPYRDPNVRPGSTAAARTSRDTQLLLCALLKTYVLYGQPAPVNTICKAGG